MFELQVFAGQMEDAARLVADFPETTFVLVHSGMLESPADHHVAPWREGLARLAQHENVVTKLTGQGTFVHRVDRKLLELVTDTTLELFGSRRCMWGTNFPVESIWTDFASLVGAWRDVLAGRPEDVRRDVLGATAERVYAL